MPKLLVRLWRRKRLSRRMKGQPQALLTIQQVGDMVECQLEGTMIWLRGTIVNVHLEQALYDVALEPVRGPMPLHVRRSMGLGVHRSVRKALS